MAETWESEEDVELDAVLRAVARATPVDPEQFMERLQPSRIAPGTRIDDAFVIERLLARGGMGVVYLARHELLQRPVAIKLCRRRATRAQTDRLLKEARAMAALSHPNVVAVYHVGVFDAQVYIAMEYVEGGTLRSWCAERIREPSEILEVFVAAGRGLEAAHAGGFVHRDFKPDNVLVGLDGRIRVSDFGLVSDGQASNSAIQGCEGESAGESESESAGESAGESESQQGSRDARTLAGAGTPLYMAPEQRARQPVTSAADQYSLCRSLRELLDDAQQRAEHRGERLRRIPRRVEAALLRGLQPDPAARFPSLEGLLHALQPRRRRRSAFALIVLLAVSLTTAVTWKLSTPSARDCSSGREQMAAVWASAHQRSSLRASIEDADTYRVLEGGLDRFASQWVAAFEQTCDATVLPTVALAAESRACLGEMLAYFDETMRALTEPAARGESDSMEALYTLPALGQCVDVGTLQRRMMTTRSAAQAARVAALRMALARIRAASLVDAGNPSMAHVDAAIGKARVLGDQGSLAAALLVRARIGAEAAEDPHYTVALFEEAFLEAEAAGDDRLRAAIGAQIVYFIGVDQAKPAEALAWGIRTQAVLTRLGASGDAQAGSLHDSLGRVQLAAGQLAEAAESLQSAVSFKDSALGRDHPSTASTRLALGQLLLRQGEHERARAVLEAAEQGFHDSLGPRSAGGTRVRLALAELAEERGDDEEALALMNGVLAQWEEERGLDDPRLILPLTDLGRAQSRIGRHDEAIEAYARAREIAERALGPDHVQTAWALLNEAEGLLAAGEASLAVAELSRAVGQMRAQPSPIEGLDGEALAARAEALLETGWVWAALFDARQVLTGCAKRACEPTRVARAGFVEARALDASGRRDAAELRVHAVLAVLPDERRTHRLLRRAMQRWLEAEEQR